MARRYSVKDVVISVCNLVIDSGYADGEFAALEKESDDFTDEVGSDGEVAMSPTNDERATLRIVLMQTSRGNAILSALLKTQKESGGKVGAGPFLMTDIGGTSKFAGDVCWIKRAPDARFNRGPESREWLVRIPNLKDFHGENAEL